MEKLSSVGLCGWMRFKHLLLLLHLDRCRNMHAAARHMHLSQPAASKMLRDLENYFGFAIFERQPRAMVPTELGAQLVRHAEILLNDAERMVEDLQLRREGGYGRLLIGAIPAAAPEILPAAIAALKQRRPRLSVTIDEQSSDRLLQALEYKQLDLLIGRLTAESQHNLFDFEPLLEEPLRVVVGRNHPLADCQRIDLASLSSWPWILHPPASPMRQVFEAALAEVGIASPDDIIETTSTQTILQLLLSAPMLAVLPRSVLKRPLSSGQYAVLPLTIGKPLNHYGIITRKHEPLPPATAELVAELRRRAVSAKSLMESLA